VITGLGIMLKWPPHLVYQYYQCVHRVKQTFSPAKGCNNLQVMIQFVTISYILSQQVLLMKHSHSASGSLHELGYRLTPQRIMILEAVEQADSHISAEDIYTQARSQYPYMNISTVYRTLELLEKLGLVMKTDFGEGRVRYHPADKGHHHHLVCQQCGAIIDVDESTLARLQDVLLARYDFRASLRHVAIFGLCSNCRE